MECPIVTALCSEIPSEIIMSRERDKHSKVIITLPAGSIETAAAFLPDLWQGVENLPGLDIRLRWRVDSSVAQDCFFGYIEYAEATICGMLGYVTLTCTSHSRLLDLHRRFRIWQSCTLSDICRQLAERSSGRIVLGKERNNLTPIEVALRAQYDETDFEFLTRVLKAANISFRIDDLEGKVIVSDNARLRAKIMLPQSNAPWTEITRIVSPILVAQARADKAAMGYIPSLVPDKLSLNTEGARNTPEIGASKTTSSNSSADTLRLIWENDYLDVCPGDPVQFAGQEYIVDAIYQHYIGTSSGCGQHPAPQNRQELHLKNQNSSNVNIQARWSLDYQNKFANPPAQKTTMGVNSDWKQLLGRVTQNDGDPSGLGRVQVEFDAEKLDPTTVARRCWLPVVVPYSGDGKKHNIGFFALPEIGDRVIVNFLCENEEMAYINGSLKDKSTPTSESKPREQKAWRTPSGNTISFFSQGDGKMERVQISCGGHIAFETVITDEKASMCLIGPTDAKQSISLEKIGENYQIRIKSRGDIQLASDGNLHLCGKSVKISGEEAQIQVANGFTAEGSSISIKSSGKLEIAGARIDLNKA